MITVPYSSIFSLKSERSCSQKWLSLVWRVMINAQIHNNSVIFVHFNKQYSLPLDVMDMRKW